MKEIKNLPVVFTGNQKTRASSSVLAKSTGGKLGLPATLKVNDLLSAPVAIQTFATIAKELGIRKMSLDVLALAFGVKQSTIEFHKRSISPEQEDIADVIARSIEDEKDEDVRMELYNSCDAVLKAQLAIPNMELNIDLYELVDLDGSDIRKMFMQKVGYVVPQEGRSVFYYSQLDEYTSEQLTNILNAMPIHDARDVVAQMNPKVLYLLTTSEISAYCGEGDSGRVMEIRCALEYYDSIPPQCALLSWIQQNSGDVYQKVCFDIKNNEYPELRSMFSEELDMRDLLKRISDHRLWERHSDDRKLPESDIEDIIDSIDSPDIRDDGKED